MLLIRFIRCTKGDLEYFADMRVGLLSGPMMRLLCLHKRLQLIITAAARFTSGSSIAEIDAECNYIYAALTVNFALLNTQAITNTAIEYAAVRDEESNHSNKG